jgi:acetamidase/formamidase
MSFQHPENMSFEHSGFPAVHHLRALPETVHWGYFSSAIKPPLTIESGDITCVQAVSQHAGDAPDLMMDEAIRAIYEQIPVEDRAPGVHIMTGPIYVKDARPGDMLEVQYLAMKPRFAYGSNLTANWGYLFNEMDKKERVTIFKLDEFSQTASPFFAYDVNGAYTVVGRITEPVDGKREYFANPLRIPMRLHLGTAGLAPDDPGRISTVPPGQHGGNIDNRGIGPGSTMYYPVLVEGGLLSIGDPHAAQGDSEIAGTAIEISMDVTMQIRIRKDFYFDSPLLATPEYFATHGFDANLNDAMKQAALRMLHFLTSIYGLKSDDAYTLMSVAVDFSVTQVVDEKFGIHAKIQRSILQDCHN